MRLLLPWLILFLGACAWQNPQPPVSIANWQKHTEHLQQLDLWLLEGKLGYRDSRDGGSAWVNWRQSGTAFDVQLHGPFGSGATRILGDDNHAELQQSGEDTLTAESPAALTEQLFGWQWPVDQLQFWVRGIPSPHEPTVLRTHNAEGTLAALQQSNWQLEFTGYEQVGQWVLPSRIKGNSGEFSFTLIVKRWHPGDTVP